MADWADVRRLALAPPETDERVSRENRQWRVKDKLFVWERPLRPKEEEVVTEAWLARAPKRLVEAFLADPI